METSDQTTAKKSFKCEVCDESFIKFSTLQKHMTYHAGLLIICHICGKTFKRQWNLKDHMVIHTNPKSHKCDICGKGFTTLYNAKEHMKIHTGEKPHACNICEKTFARSQHLKSHLLTHSGVKPIECSTCGKSFTKRSNFLQHWRVHTGEKPFSCKICGRCFAQTSSLKSHMSTHSKEKPYKCEKCDRSFLKPSELKNHQAQHTGLKAYECEMCGKEYTSKNSLNVHMKKSAKDKDFDHFSCETCGQKCITRSCLKHHMLSHNDDRPYKCSLCIAYYKTEAALKRHFKMIHEKEACSVEGNVEKEDRYLTQREEIGFLQDGNSIVDDVMLEFKSIIKEEYEMTEEGVQENAIIQDEQKDIDVIKDKDMQNVVGVKEENENMQEIVFDNEYDIENDFLQIDNCVKKESDVNGNYVRPFSQKEVQSNSEIRSDFSTSKSKTIDSERLFCSETIENSRDFPFEGFISYENILVKNYK